MGVAMGLHPHERVEQYTRDGWWTGDTVDRLFRDKVAARPGAVAIVDPPNKPSLMDGAVRRLSWAELDVEVDRIAAVLLESGAAAGDVVAVQLPNSVELAVTFLAGARIGAVITPLPVQYREYELTQVITMADVKVFVTADRVGDRENAEIVRRLEVPAPPVVLAWGDPARDLETATADPAVLAAHLKGLETDPNDCVTICWTSGTEATPKGVPRCHYDWFAVENTTTAAPALTGDDVVLNPFPMVNMAGIGGVFLPWLRTGFVLVQHHPFDLLVYLDQISEERVTYTLAPPALLTMLLQKPEMLERYDIASLTRIGSGSAPLPPWMVKGWQERHGIAIINFFGSNEGIALLSDPVHIPDPEERARFFPRPGAAGDWPGTLAATRVKLVDPSTGEEVTEPGRPGELRLSGPTVFAGYLPGTAAADPFDEDGYLVTGDVFEIAGPGGRYLRFVDRTKDLIIRGGTNISAAELEGLLAGHPAVMEAAIVGYPDEVLGERVCAVVVPRDDVDLPALVSFLRDKGLASYKLPERLQVVEGLPRNAVGKILKRELRDRL
ncbi:class I adenylate-forming enzyme family protein [Sphaerisporangium krabiense]|uniref:Acyl-CoA synthetase (AMP-forming)/AMP-acid ligase II n=1 Tax=Sphaerisporangium krabiense TaxID=763782 RepID=A0A7W9DMQ1_9ACTN|nr:class I adenylate-forming enzyme family protein [Sphaerisporangium krabiense]MBB5624533.1 acyl-CoA synthetase (AMP-forming)/AMP-acid ligase II [Sphaerisporangium krabiense]